MIAAAAYLCAKTFDSVRATQNTIHFDCNKISAYSSVHQGFSDWPKQAFETTFGASSKDRKLSHAPLFFFFGLPFLFLEGGQGNSGRSSLQGFEYCCI
jgi:hypothetical protein